MATVALPENSLAQIAAFVHDADVDVVHLTHSEGLSELYECQIEFTLGTADTRLPMKAVIGAPACVGIRSRSASTEVWETRYVHGVVSRLRYLGELQDPASTTYKSRYSATIVPKLWFLSQNRKCRIFQGKAVPVILASVLGEYSISITHGDADGASLRGQYPPLEYCVQYNESDFEFISRLMEHCGISYFFKHDASAVKLYITDSVEPYFFCRSNDKALSSMGFGTASTGTSVPHIRSWNRDCEFRPGSFAHGDFNYDKADANLRSLKRDSTLIFGTEANGQSIYEYPGDFAESGGSGSASENLKYGENLADVRIDGLESLQDIVRGTSHSVAIASGAKFQLTGHPVDGENGIYTVKSVRYSSTGEDGATLPADAAVFVSFECFPAATRFLPPRRSHRPFIPGPQTAIVTNAKGSLKNTAGPGQKANVNTDKSGRVRVRFHWDVATAADSSCWVRVSQAWAGSGYGSLMIPHVGNEVVVSFLEGNPDRPLITGRVYNSLNKPPVDDQATGVAANPNRTIVAQDEVGNKIILDADEKRVDIKNAQDKFELTVGTKAEATAGLNFSVTLGCGVGINLGAAVTAELAASYGLHFGWSTSVFMGGTWSASVGASFTYAWGRYVNAGDSLGQISFKDPADFISKSSASLIGGSTVNNSVVRVNSNDLVLSYGPVDPTMVADYSMGKAMLLTSFMGSIGAASAGATAFLGATAADKGKFDGHAVGAVVSGTASVAASLTACLLLKGYARSLTAMQQPVHAAPLSRIKLSASGVTATSMGLMINHAQTSIKNYANTTYEVISPMASFSGAVDVAGPLSSPNIRDLGDPSAVAAAVAQVQSMAAAAQAEAAADAAADQATRAAAEIAASTQDEGMAPV